MSRTRSPNRSCSPRVRPNTLPPARDVDAGDEHALVAGELGFERGADRVHRAEHRRVGRRAPAVRRRSGRGADDEVGQRGDRRSSSSRRAASTASSSSRRDRRLHRRRARRRRRPPIGAGARGRAADRAPPTPGPRRSIGSAAGRLRSGRASGRSPPRRRRDRARRAPRRRPSCIAAAVATTSLPSTAT